MMITCTSRAVHPRVSVISMSAVRLGPEIDDEVAARAAERRLGREQVLERDV